MRLVAFRTSKFANSKTLKKQNKKQNIDPVRVFSQLFHCNTQKSPADQTTEHLVNFLFFTNKYEMQVFFRTNTPASQQELRFSNLTTYFSPRAYSLVLGSGAGASEVRLLIDVLNGGIESYIDLCSPISLQPSPIVRCPVQYQVFLALHTVCICEKRVLSETGHFGTILGSGDKP